jgi:hypothetical protein
MKRMHLMEFFTLLFFLPSYASNGALRYPTLRERFANGNAARTLTHPTAYCRGTP